MKLSAAGTYSSNCLATPAISMVCVPFVSCSHPVVAAGTVVGTDVVAEEPADPATVVGAPRLIAGAVPSADDAGPTEVPPDSVPADVDAASVAGAADEPGVLDVLDVLDEHATNTTLTASSAVIRARRMALMVKELRCVATAPMSVPAPVPAPVPRRLRRRRPPNGTGARLRDST